VTLLAVTAHLRGPISLPRGMLGLDSLLIAAVCLRENRPPISVERDDNIPIPVAKSACGRFYLASFAHAAWETHDIRWINRRFPTPEAQMFGDSRLKTINVASGAQKSYRIPLETGHVHGDVLRFWCEGDAPGIRTLLPFVRYLGKRRAVGLGAVERWDVEPCDPWPGAPVVRGGRPLRPLPRDWPGVTEADVGSACLLPPYYELTRQEPVLLPYEDG
jgi:hypothetical protein